MNGQLKHPTPVIAAIIGLLVTTGIFAQTNIPGVSNRYNTDEMIDEIIEAEKEPIRRQEQRIEELEAERRAWQRLGGYLSSLEESAANLYGFRNPFSDRIAESSDPDALTARADRGAEQQRAEIEVLQIATPDIFQSQSVPADLEVPAGHYEFSVGEQREGFEFPGGNLDDFIAMANEWLDEILEIRSIRDTRDTRVLLFRSQITGKNNELGFHEDAKTLAVETGVIEPVDSQAAELTPTEANTVVQAGERGEAIFDDTDTLVVGPTATAEIRTDDIAVPPEFVLEIELFVRNLGEPEYEEPEEPEGPALPDPGEVELDGITVPFADSLVEIPEWTPPERPEEVEDLEILFILADGRELALPPVEDTEDLVTFEFPLGEMTDRLEAVEIRNRNTFREIHVGEIHVYDPEARDEFRPLQVVEEASDAVFTVDGVRVTRDTNEIDDVIDDVTLELNSPSRGPLSIDIQPDFEHIEDQVIEFLANYNELMTEINILTRRNREVIEQIGWLEPDEVEAAEERLGMLQGNTTLSRLRSRLQTIMMDPHETRAGSRIRLLAHVGVSTNSSGAASGVDFSRLRGYLELDEETFESAIVNDHEALRELFGRDSDGNGTIDSGAAYEIEQYVRAFTRTGGLLATRERTIESSIDRAETEISRQRERIERQEDRLRREFAQMERSVEEMESIRNRLEGLQDQSGNR